MISQRTLDLINDLMQVPWFRHVGQPLPYDTAVQVETWDRAMALLLSNEWEIARLDARNGLTGLLNRDHTMRFQSWNKHIRAIDDHLKEFIAEVASDAIEKHRLPPEFAHVLLDTTRMACMEEEYSDLLQPAFFSEVASWYGVGHLPCGLTGKYPEGKLFVY